VRGFGFSGVDSGFTLAGFEVLVDNVLEPVILAAIATARFEWRGKLLFLNKPIDVLAGVLDSLRFEVPITDNSSHLDVPCHGDEPFVASRHPR
jgi:hypothetical protein